VIVSGGNAEHCYSFDRENGNINWEIETGPVLAPPIATEDKIIIGTINNGIVILNFNGNIIKHLNNTRVGCPLALGENGLYYKTGGPSVEVVYFPTE